MLGSHSCIRQGTWNIRNAKGELWPKMLLSGLWLDISTGDGHCTQVSLYNFQMSK